MYRGKTTYGMIPKDCSEERGSVGIFLLLLLLLYFP